MQNFKTLSVVLILSLSGSACFQTRRDIREEEEPIPARVVRVEPQDQYVIDELKSEITRLNGRIEDLQRKQFNQDLEGRIADLESKQAEILQLLKGIELQALKDKDKTPEEIFEDANAAFNKGYYTKSVEKFEEYLALPDIENGEDASFLKSEALFNLRKYKKSILSYNQFVEKYGKSKQGSKAFYKIGLAFEALGNKSDAQAFYQEVIDRYPKSSEAEIARSKVGKSKPSKKKKSGKNLR